MFGVSRQSFYKRKQSHLEKQAQQCKVVELVQGVRMNMPRIGTRKLYHILGEELNKLRVGRDKLFKILHINHMLVSPRKSYHKTTNSKHWLKKHKNKIIDLDINKPEQVWVSDITYIKTDQGHNYLSLVTDAYSKKIMGYYLSEDLKTEGCLKAVEMAIKNRRYERPIIHHSDRGLQYCSDDYQSKLRASGIETSMTESYDPYQNAIAERVNGILKDEFLLGGISMDRAITKKIIKESIDIYNTQRPHYSCGYLTPEQMHQQGKLKPKSYKKTHLQEQALEGEK